MTAKFRGLARRNGLAIAARKWTLRNRPRSMRALHEPGRPPARLLSAASPKALSASPAAVSRLRASVPPAPTTRQGRQSRLSASQPHRLGRQPLRRTSDLMPSPIVSCSLVGPSPPSVLLTGQNLTWYPNSECRKRTDNGPARAASGRSGVRSKVTLRARNNLNSAELTLSLSMTNAF